MTHQRNSMTFTALALLAALISTVWPANAGAAPPAIEVGKPFPDLVLPSLANGQPMSIAEFRGEKVVLHVFASW